MAQDVASARPRTRPTCGERFYYGWVVLGVAALAMVGTLPGRTQGLGLITEPLLRDLGISRVAFAQINLVATLVGALFCIGIGKLIDRAGSRIVLTVTALALGLTVLGMSQASGALAMLVAVTLTRGFGQSALSVVSLAMVGKWFRRRLTLAMAVYALVMSIGFMAAFPLVGAHRAVVGMAHRVGGDRRVPRVRAGADGMAVRSIVAGSDRRRGGRRRPRSSDEPAGQPACRRRWARRCARRRSGCSRWPAPMYGLVASGIGLLNESILVERGFTPDIYYQALAVTAITGLFGNFAAGALAGRTSLRSILVAALLVLAGGLAALAHVIDRRRT